MYKKVLCILLTVTVLAAGMYYYAPSPVSAEDETLHLSLDEAIEMAMEENAEINLARVGVEKAKTNLRKVNRRADNLEDARDAGASFRQIGISSYDYALSTRVAPRSAEMELLLAERGLEATKRGIKISVENAYYDVLKAEGERENVKGALRRAEEHLRLAEVGYEVGSAARLEIINAEVNLAGKKAAVTAAENAYKASIMDFNNVIGLPLDEKVNLTSSFEFEPAEIELSAVIEEAKEYDISYLAAQEGKAVAEKVFEVASGHYTPNVFTYREAEYDYEEAKMEADQAEKELELNVNKAYLNLKSAEERYNTVEKSVKQAEESYRLTKLRYEVGMSTQLEMEDAGGNHDEAKAELLNALYDYNLMKAQFKHAVFGGGI